MKTHRFSTALTALLALAGGYFCAPAHAQYDEKYRPQYHFSPQNGWMADPDGLVYRDGLYHLLWWGHAVSRDLVHWTELPWPMKGGDGSFDYYTGSVVVDKSNTAGFGADSMVAIYSMHDKNNGKETVGLSSSQNYTDFNFYGGNPVMDENTDDFRDPQVFWHAPTNRWIMVITLPGLRVVHFYASSDLKNWQYLSDFGGLGAQGTLWETPDLFQLPVDGDTNNKKWVLSVGVAPNRTQYFTGDFDGTRFVADEPTRSFLGGESGNGTVYADFNGTSYNGWTTTGTAFGFGPDRWPTPPHFGAGQVNSFGGSDAATGTLTSPVFNISKKAINFFIAGGNHPGQTCINLLVNGQVVRSATGDGTLALKGNGWDVSEFIGQNARLQIVDSYSGNDLGYVTLDHITFSDQLRNQTMEQGLWADWGSDFYAARTWRNYDNEGGRAVWCGWLGNWNYAAQVPTSWGKGFTSIPREIALTSVAEGVRLTQTPIPELRKLRGPQTSFFNRDIANGTTDLTEFRAPRNCYEIEAEFDATTNTTFGFNLLVGNGRRLMLGYNARNSNLFIDRTNTSDWSNAAFATKMTAPVAAENGVLKLRIFVDQSSIEVFTNRGQVVLSATTFPGDNQTGIQLFSEDGTSHLRSFRAWGLKTSWNQGAYKSHFLPGTLEAEDFNSGGEGAGYHDADSANRGGKYRPDEGVDIEECSEGGHNVAYLEAGEWLDYNVKSNANRTYQITTRVAGVGGSFHLEMDGTDVTGPITVSDTGGFQKWASVTRNINVPMGESTLRFVVEEGGFNVDKFLVSNVLPGGLYKISARHSAKVLDSMGPEDGAGLQQWNYLDGANQKWRVEQLENGAYRLTSHSSGKVVDVDGTENGILPLLWPWWGGDKQRWILNNVADEFYSITGKESGKSLEVRDFSRDDGARVQQWQYLGGENQQWKFDLIEPLAGATLSVGDVRIREGDAGTSNAVFTVTLSAPATQIVRVGYATADGTATSSDYEGRSGTLTIPVGQTQGTIAVPVKGDALHEDDETFVLNLSEPANATLARAQATATLVNDDASPTPTPEPTPTPTPTPTPEPTPSPTPTPTPTPSPTPTPTPTPTPVPTPVPTPSSNRPPAGASSSVNTQREVPIVVPLALSDPDADDSYDTLEVIRLAGGLRKGTGGIRKDSDGVWKLFYKASRLYDGNDSVQYVVRDRKGAQSQLATITINIFNTKPTARSTQMQVAAGGAASLPLFGADNDNDALTFKRVGGPAKGTGEIRRDADGVVRFHYQNSPIAIGNDRVQFVTLDGKPGGVSEIATISITVVGVFNRAPSAQSVTGTTPVNTPVAVAVAGSDPDEGDVLTFKRVGGPRNGTGEIARDADGAFKMFYTPRPDFVGSETISYVAVDSKGRPSAPATITITVTPSEAAAIKSGPAPSAGRS